MLIHVRLASCFVSLLCFFFITITRQQDNCLSRSITTSIVKLSNTAVKSQYVKKTFKSVSFIQCGLRCEQNDWCVSISFADSKQQQGRCDLTDFGLENHDGVLSDKLQKRNGFVFTQLRKLKVLPYNSSN